MKTKFVRSSGNVFKDLGLANAESLLQIAKNSQKKFVPAEPSCLLCGCTDNDCRQCIERTGRPCKWVAEWVCSACLEKHSVDANVNVSIDTITAFLGVCEKLHGDRYVDGKFNLIVKLLSTAEALLFSCQPVKRGTK